MAYVIPSPQVYQQLESSGGVLNSTPDLHGCIIGPVYNVVRYEAGSAASLITTAADSSVSATGSIQSGSDVLTFGIQSPFAVGDTVHVPGATSAGSVLSASVISVSGRTARLSARAGSSVTDVIVRKTGVIVDSTVQNPFTIPSQKPGQLVEADSVQVYLNNAKVETLVTKFAGFAGRSQLNILPSQGTGAATAGSAVVTGVTNIDTLAYGDTVTVQGAGVSGATLTSKILSISGSSITLATSAATTSATAAITKVAISNVNPSTFTLLVEPGDEVELSYQDQGGVSRTLASNVSNVVNLNGTLEMVDIYDMLPANASQATTAASVTSGTASVTVDSSTGFVAGDQVLIPGAGVGGTDLVTTIGSITDNTLSGLNPAPGASVVGARVIRRATVTVKTRKTFNNQLLPQVRPSLGGSNLNLADATTTGTVVIQPNPEIVYGRVVAGDVHIAYRALRRDLSGTVGTIVNPRDIEGTLGEISDENPLALGVQLAQANTTTEIKFIAVESDDLQGYLVALELAEGQRLYTLVPLTQDMDILMAFRAHVEQLSTPEEANWRIAVVNTEIPSRTSVGQYSEGFVNANGGNNTVTVINGRYVLTASNATFMTDGVVPGDTVNIVSGTGAPSPIGAIRVLMVLNNQQLVLEMTSTATAVSYYVTRTLSKTQQAAAVAAMSRGFGTKRVYHIPNVAGVTINGVVKYLPGYYFCAAIAGLIAGMPVQQGFTNIGLAGIADVKMSNLYFTRAQMGVMAEAGTFLIAQETQGSIPYVRHQLSTDVSVLEYRELLLVKNLDFISYFFYDKLKPFIGQWNIVQDTMNTIRQTLVSGAELLKSKKLPRIGPPLIDLKIDTLEQDQNNKDRMRIRTRPSVVYPLNYADLYLVI